MPDPIDISTFPKAPDLQAFTPREAEAYDLAWTERRRAVRDLAAAMRSTDAAALADALAPAMAAAARCHAIDEAVAERIRQEQARPDGWAAEAERAADWMRLVIGQRIDGDRASENDLAQRGAYDQAVDELADAIDRGSAPAVRTAARNVVELHRGRGR